MNFFVVGGQKCGTTSLYHYLSRHPQIFLPIQKETEFFYRDDYYSMGIKWYMQTYFAKSKAGQILGEVCPQYMFSNNTPELIHKEIPHSKIIMLLRDPVDRAFSHYRMSHRRNRENRSFSKVISDDITASKNGNPPNNPDKGYLHFGEYGRIYSQYLNFFPAHAISVVFSDDLLNNRLETLNNILVFLGVDPMLFKSHMLNEYNVGGTRRFSKINAKLRSSELLKKLLRIVLGESRYSQLWYWYETEFTVKQNRSNNMAQIDEELLTSYFSPDIKKLEFFLGKTVPWERFKDKA